MTEAEQRRAVVAEAMTWLGTRYHHRGRVKGAGVDCGQILIAVYASQGLIQDFDPGYYPSDWALHRSDEVYLSTVLRYAHEVPFPGPGDIAVWRFGRCYSHGAIVIDWPLVIHAHRRVGFVELARDGEGELYDRAPRFFSFW